MRRYCHVLAVAVAVADVDVAVVVVGFELMAGVERVNETASNQFQHEEERENQSIIWLAAK